MELDDLQYQTQILPAQESTFSLTSHQAKGTRFLLLKAHFGIFYCPDGDGLESKNQAAFEIRAPQILFCSPLCQVAVGKENRQKELVYLLA